MFFWEPSEDNYLKQDYLKYFEDCGVNLSEAFLFFRTPLVENLVEYVS